MFFSNILDYIANHIPEVIAAALKDFLPQDGFSYSKRESKHMDLVFFNHDDKPVLVIENKRGSIATKKQLEKYHDQIDKSKKKKLKDNSNCSFLLISPNKFEKDLADSAGWQFMGYAELGNKLNCAINELTNKAPEYKFSLEYQILNLATDYMVDFEKESCNVFDSVDCNTICSDLHYDDDSMDIIKLRYCAVARLLIDHLSKKKIEGIEASFDPGTSAPLVNVEIKNFMQTSDGPVNFNMQFQGDILSIGFGKTGKFDSLGKVEKKEERFNYWENNNFANILSNITKGKENFDNYKGTGYMTTEYIISMYRINVSSKTVGEIIDMMTQYAEDALNYLKNDK